jgi:hypothetical protein
MRQWQDCHLDLDFVLKLAIAVQLVLVGGLDGSGDGHAQFDDDAAGLFGREPGMSTHCRGFESQLIKIFETELEQRPILNFA